MTTRPGNWWPCFDCSTTDAQAQKIAARKLSVPEKRIEFLRTGGGVLTRVKQEKVNVSSA